MKKAFYIGLILGGILGVVVALSMDILLGQSLGGGWREAVANDLNRMFDAHLSQNNVFVILGTILVIAMIGGFGAIIGGICSVIIARFFKTLTRDRD